MNKRNGFITPPPPPSFENIRYIYFVATHKLILNFSKALEKQKRHGCHWFRTESSSHCAASQLKNVQGSTFFNVASSIFTYINSG